MLRDGPYHTHFADEGPIVLPSSALNLEHTPVMSWPECDLQLEGSEVCSPYATPFLSLYSNDTTPE